ncbi:hypothetical protein GCM10011517_14520 [Actibacterium pelagium]|uniref:Uncharacterized protein n=2 Tax=Actibacterium pelagium TaxID=2029103 RepID=A0A917EIR4_9RHOB|nr:hypothetical protein GCM10011517_14520 [Actibacterium pelagium]
MRMQFLKRKAVPMPKTFKMRTHILAVTLATAGTAPLADTVPEPRFPPDRTDLRFYFACNALAETRLPSFGEASTCGMIFERLKLSLVSQMSFEDFNQLPLRERNKLSLRGYRALHLWMDEHQKVVELLKDEVTADQIPTVE